MKTPDESKRGIRESTQYTEPETLSAPASVPTR